MHDGWGVTVTSPATMPVAPQEAAGAGPRGKETGSRLSPYVRVLNAVWNGSGYIKRKVANRYIGEKRGHFLDNACTQMLLDMKHPANMAAAVRASVGYHRVYGEFEWHMGTSDGATVLVTEKSNGQERNRKRSRPPGQRTT